MPRPGCPRGSMRRYRRLPARIAVAQVARAQDSLIAPEDVLGLEGVSVRITAGLDADLGHLAEQERFAGHIATDLGSEVPDHLGKRREHARLTAFLIA